MKQPDHPKLNELRQRRQKRREELTARIQEARELRRQRLKYLKTPDLKSLKERHLKKLTILHSNDLHGDFLAENLDSGLVGGVSMLSGYINKVRNEEENVLYAVAGDMFRGSIIDSEFKGLSTIEMMNLLAPDVVTIGNHEVDYGLAHLLFIEKCANFPIINANMYLIHNGKRLFNSHIILESGGLKILFIGVLTKDVLTTTKQEEFIGTLVDIQNAAEQVSKITDAYKTADVDLTVLLTHIGFEEDKKLAAALDPGCAVDLIIGGHSHTYLEEPCVVAGIPIVQAAVGTAQIGRFDIIFDERRNCIDSYTWEPIAITEDHCPRDKELEEVISKYKEKTDVKYGRILTRFPRAYTHPRRDRQTELGALLAEGMRKQLDVDLALIGSGSIRGESLGPIVTLQDFMEVFPYSDEMIGMNLTGAQLRQILMYLMRDEAIVEGAHCECFQFSGGFFCEYDCASHSILQIAMNGREVRDDDIFRTAIESYHYICMEEALGISPEEVEKNGPPVELAGDSGNVLEAFLSGHDYIKLDEEERLVIREKKCR